MGMFSHSGGWLTLPLSVGEQQAGHHYMVMLFHQNTNVFSKVSDDIIGKGWGNNKENLLETPQ